jgi:hypothetical protein
MSEPPRQPSYRTRNIVLAAIAIVIAVAAGVRVALTSPSHPHAAAPMAQPKAGVAPPQAPQLPVAADSATGAIDVSVTYHGDATVLPATAKVYVFIRPVGQRMPLAVQTYAVGDLPTSVEFSSPSESSAGAKIEAVARLSLTGAVSLKPGDSEVVSDPVGFDDARHQVALSLPGTAVK